MAFSPLRPKEELPYLKELLRPLAEEEVMTAPGPRRGRTGAPRFRMLATSPVPWARLLTRSAARAGFATSKPLTPCDGLRGELTRDLEELRYSLRSIHQ